MSNHTLIIVWDDIPYPFPSFNGSTVDVWECISHITPHIIIYVITNPKLIYLSKRVPWLNQHETPLVLVIIHLLRTHQGHINVHHLIYPSTVSWKLQSSKAHTYFFALHFPFMGNTSITNDELIVFPSFWHVLCTGIYLNKSLVAGLCVHIHDISTQIIHFFSLWIRNLHVKGNWSIWSVSFGKMHKGLKLYFIRCR